MQSDICGGGQNMEVVNLWYFMISVYKRQIQTSGDYKKFKHHIISSFLYALYGALKMQLYAN